MGDTAGEAFNRFCNERMYKRTRFGFDRPDLDAFWWLPKVIRYAPDFILEVPSDSVSGYSHYFVEVKGCGNDKTIKIKKDDVWALGEWEDYLPVYIFAYNKGDWRIASLKSIKSGEFDIGTFSDNDKEYYKIPFKFFKLT